MNDNLPATDTASTELTAEQVDELVAAFGRISESVAEAIAILEDVR